MTHFRLIPVFALTVFAVFPLRAFNVLDFGAVGDGKTDDTAAIQKALNHISFRIKLKRFQTEDGWKKGHPETFVDELVFPDGIYRISRTLYVKGSIVMRGKGKTVIQMTDPKQDIIYLDYYRRAVFRNIELRGGKRQIVSWSRNWNASSVFVEDCVFRDSADSALHNRSRRFKPANPKAKVELVPPYDVVMGNEVPKLTPRDVLGPDTMPYYSSNIIYVCNSRFLNCIRAFELDNDGTLIDQCHIVANPETEGPIILEGVGLAPNQLLIQRTLFEAPATKKTQYWIRHEGFFISCRDCEFRSEKPMLLLDQDTPKIKSPAYSGVVSITRCKFNSARNPFNAIVRHHRAPNIFTFIGNMGKEQTDLAQWLFKPTKKYLDNDTFPGKHRGLFWDLSCKYQLLIAGNKGINVNVPDGLKPFMKEVPPEVGQAPRRSTTPKPEFKGVIFAKDFGVKADGISDDSEAFRRALAAAAKKRCEVVLPAGYILLKSTVTLPPYTSLRGEGMPVIQGEKRDAYDLFNIPEAGDIRFDSLIMRNGKRFINGSLTGKSRLFRLTNCVFYDSGPVSVLLKNKGGKKNRCEFIMTGSLWNGSGSIDSEAEFNEVNLCWLSNNYWMDDEGMFKLRGGELVMNMGFTVPYITKNQRRRNTVTGEEKIWKKGTDPRWIDNYGGNIQLYDCRGGGEAGGYCMIRQCAPGGTVLMEGGYDYFYNKETTHCLFYAASAPDRAVFAGVGGYPISKIAGVEIQVWNKAPGVPDFPVQVIGVMTTQPRNKENHTAFPTRKTK